MKISAMLSACALLAACGSYDAPQKDGVRPVSPIKVGKGQPDKPLPTPQDIPTFPIDAGVGVTLYDTTYAITTNGTDWILAWTGDGNVHEFAGDILAPANADISNVIPQGLFEGDYVEQVANYQISFDTQTDGSNVQVIQFTSNGNPVRWNIYIDGYPAVFAVVYSSSNVESTTDTIPFDLLPQGAAQAKPTQPAPAFHGGKGQSHRGMNIIKAPAPRATR